MSNDILKLYPQYKQQSDRRQQDKPVTFEQRSGMDTNETSNLRIDPKLNQDINITKDVFAAFRADKDVFVKQVKKYDDASKKKQDNTLLEGALNTIPTTRRIISVENNKDNPIKAVGLALIGLINVKEDLRDLMSFFGRTKSEAPKDYYAKYKFFTGTPFEKWLGKTQWGQEFYDIWDTTLADTKFSEKIYNFLGIKEDVQAYEKEIKIPFCEPETVNRMYVKHEGKFISRLAGLTLNRITKIGLLVMSLLELPVIYKAIKDKNDYTQIPESAVNVVCCSTCGALGSALLSLATGGLPAASVIGLGLGLFIGNKLSKFISKDK